MPADASNPKGDTKVSGTVRPVQRARLDAAAGAAAGAAASVARRDAPARQAARRPAHGERRPGLPGATRAASARTFVCTTPSPLAERGRPPVHDAVLDGTFEASEGDPEHGAHEGGS